MEELAGWSADLGLGVLLPAPAGLQDVTGDDGPGEPNLVAVAEGTAHHRLGLVEVAHFDPARMVIPSSDPRNIAATAARYRW